MDISLLRKEGYKIGAFSRDNNYVRFSLPSGQVCMLSSKFKFSSLFGETIESELRLSNWGVVGKIGRTSDQEMLKWIKYVTTEKPTCQVDPNILKDIDAILPNKFLLHSKQYYINGAWLKGGAARIFSTNGEVIASEHVNLEIVYLIVEFRESGDIYLKTRTDTSTIGGWETVISQPVKMSAISDITNLIEKVVTLKKLEYIDYLPKSNFKF